MRSYTKIQKTEEVKWKMMPENSVEFKAMIQKTEKDFAKGKGLSTNEIRKIVSSWK